MHQYPFQKQGMFNTSLEQRKQIMKGIVMLDEDDIQDLPAMNEKTIKKLIRDLQNGDKIEISQIQKQKLGNFKRDIISAILLHKYDSLETAINILRQLYDCAIDFVKILNTQCIETQKQFSKILISEEGTAKLIALQEKHIYFVLSAAGAGFDKNNKTLCNVLKLIQNQLITFCLYVSTFLQTGHVAQQLQTKIHFNLADYFISMQNIFSEVHNCLFTSSDQCEALIEPLTLEAVQKMSSSGQYSGTLQGEQLAFCQQYFGYFPEIVQQLSNAFSQLNNDAFRESKRFTDVKDQILYKNLIKELSYASKQINELIKTFGNTRTIKVLQLLSPVDEMALLQYIDQEYEKIYRVYSFRTQEQVEDQIEQLEKKHLLYSSNATLVELQFAYPFQEYLKFQIEQLPDLSIKTQIDILTEGERVHLVDHIDQLFSKVKSTDDVEYLAYALYKESPCSCDQIIITDEDDEVGDNVSFCQLHIALAKFLQNFQKRGQLEKIVHFITCFYYNGIPVYNQLVETPNSTVSQGVRINGDIINYLLYYRVQKTDDAHWLSSVLARLLERRLVSTQQLFDVVRRCSQSKDENKRERLSFTRYLVKNIARSAPMLDESFCEKIRRFLVPQDATTNSGQKRGPTNTSTSAKPGDKQLDRQYQLTALQEALNDLELSRQQTEIIKKRIQAELERRERQEKREAYMRRLKQTNEKLYKQELEKDRKRQEEQQEKMNAMNVKLQQKQQKQQKLLQKQSQQSTDIVHIIKQLLQAQNVTGSLVKQNQEMKCLPQIIAVPINYEELRIQARDISKALYAMKKNAEDDSKGASKAVQKLLQYLQTTVNLSNVMTYSHIYATVLDDMVIGKQIRALKYRENVFANVKVDKYVCLTKLMVFFAGMNLESALQDNYTHSDAVQDQTASVSEIQDMAKQILKNISLIKVQFFNDADNFMSNLIPQNYVYQIVFKSDDLDAETSEIIWKFQVLLICSWVQRDNKLMASLILIYAQLQNAWCALHEAFHAILKRYDLDEWNSGEFVKQHFDTTLHTIVEQNENNTSSNESSGIDELLKI